MEEYHLRIFSRRDLRHEIIFQATVSEEIAVEPFFKHPDDRKRGIYTCIGDTPLSLAQFARLKQKLLWAIKGEFDQDTLKRLWKAIISEPLNTANFATLEKIFKIRVTEKQRQEKRKESWSSYRTGYTDEERERAQREYVSKKLKELALNSNPYKYLNLDQNATDQEIKASFKKLVRKFHPDTGNSDIERYQQIVESYNRIRDLRGF